MDKRIGENNNGKYITIYSHEFKQGVKYAFDKKIQQIQLDGVLGTENINSVADFAEIEILSPYIKYLYFKGLINNTIINFDSIYSLINIERIYINGKQKFSFDVSKYANLKHLGTEYWKGLKNMNELKNLESMVITKYPIENITEISELRQLKILHIYSSKIKTLEGIEKLSNLEELILAYNRKLENIDNIKDLKFLNTFRIIKCKNIIDYDFVNNLNLKNLYIENK